MESDSVAFFFDFGDPMEFVGVGFEVVVRVIEPRDGVKPRAFGVAARDDDISHADDGGGVHAAAELGEDRAVGAEAALDGSGQGGAEVFFVFSVGTVADSPARIEIPILADDVLSGSEEHGRRRRDSVDADVRCEVRGGENRYCEPAGDVLFADFERFSCEQNERIENRAPSNLIVVERVVEMARADGVLGQDQRAIARVPDGERPISDEFGKAIGAPLFEGYCNDGHVRGSIGQGIAQFADELSTIVQAAVPGDHGSGRRNVWLLLATRFFRGVEGAIEDPYATFGIGFVAIGAVRS